MPDFSLAPLLQKGLASQEAAGYLLDDLFSLTPPPTPGVSPKTVTVDLPSEVEDFVAPTPPGSTAKIQKEGKMPPANRKERNKLKSRESARKAYRIHKITQKGGPPERSNAREKYAAAASPIVTTASTANALRASKSGYIGTDNTFESAVYSLDELVGEKSEFKMAVQAWDGQ